MRSIRFLKFNKYIYIFLTIFQSMTFFKKELQKHFYEEVVKLLDLGLQHYRY